MCEIYKPVILGLDTLSVKTVQIVFACLVQILLHKTAALLDIF